MADVQQDINLALQYKTLAEGGHEVWRTVKNFWAEAEDEFHAFDQEAGEFKVVTEEHARQLLEDAKPAVAALHNEIRVLKRVVTTYASEQAL